MAGRRFELFAKRTFDMTPVLPGETMTVELIDRLDVTDAEQGTLLLRTHSADLSGGGVPTRITCVNVSRFWRGTSEQELQWVAAPGERRAA